MALHRLSGRSIGSLRQSDLSSRPLSSNCLGLSSRSRLLSHQDTMEISCASLTVYSVIIDSAIADFACEVEITECEPLADGRFYIERLSGQKKISHPKAEVQDLTSNTAEYAKTWVFRAKEAAQRVLCQCLKCTDYLVMLLSIGHIVEAPPCRQIRDAETIRDTREVGLHRIQTRRLMRLDQWTIFVQTFSA
ncbi:hypothetical protein V2J09_010796 [Rumex salicifolius]